MRMERKHQDEIANTTEEYSLRMKDQLNTIRFQDRQLEKARLQFNEDQLKVKWRQAQQGRRRGPGTLPP